MSDTPVLRMQSVRKTFGDTVVLRDVDLEVAPHTVTALIGASGSGKSTLLRCANLLEEIDDGAIWLDEQEITDPRVDQDAVRRRIGVVFQAYNLFPHMTVLENITLAPRRVHGASRAEAEARARELLERLGLGGKAGEYPDRLSGGQQQRAAIVRALAVRPRLLLLDEITAALDPELVGEVLTVVRDLKGDGMTMVLATHEMGFARDVADQVCFWTRGWCWNGAPPSRSSAIRSRSVPSASCGGSWRRAGSEEPAGHTDLYASPCPVLANAATRSTPNTYPCTPHPAMTPSARSETYEWCRNDSR
ncbi:Vitamin B12 import ATP-binding protein BtuD [Streptomyces alboniger]